MNREKTEVGSIIGMKYFGYSFRIMRGECRLTVHSKTYDKLRKKLKAATMRSNGMGYQSRKEKMHQIIRGWIEYYQLADMQTRLRDIDEWLRRRYHMCIWKAWKKIRTRVKNLIKCGIAELHAYEWGNSSKKYWRVAKSPILHRAISRESLQKQGWPCLTDYHRLIVRVQ